MAWLPLINQYIPGSGVTPFNVWDLSFEWWRIYRDEATAIYEAMKKRSEAGRGK